jgi:hypothetical protein
VIRLAFSLRERGVGTGVFSNIEAVPYAILRARGWLDGFDPRLVAFRLGADKPDPAVFRSAGLRLPPDVSRVILIDDRWDNVRAARSAGWEAVAFSGAARLRSRLAALGVLAAGSGRRSVSGSAAYGGPRARIGVSASARTSKDSAIGGPPEWVIVQSRAKPSARARTAA